MANTIPTNLDIATATATTPKLARTVEDQAIEKYIRDAGHFLEEIRLNPGTAEALLSAGYDEDELAWGMELQDKAWNAFCSQHGGDCPPDRAQGEQELDKKVDEARDAWAKFRLIARAAFVSLDHRLDLRVMGDVPEDLQRFINVALKALSGALDRVASLDGALDAAEDTAEHGPSNTEERDAAYVRLKDYMKEIRGVARGLFRKQPEILHELSL